LPIDEEDAVSIIDVRNHLLPFSLLQICRAAKRMGAGEALEILGCNPELVRDLYRIFPAPDYEVLPKEVVWKTGEDFRMEIRKVLQAPVRS